MPEPQEVVDTDLLMDRIAADFRVAAIDNNVARMSAILKEYPACDLHASAKGIGRTALHWAILNRSEDAIAFLLNTGVVVTLPDIQNNTPYSLLSTHLMQEENEKNIVLQTIIEQYAAMIFEKIHYRKERSKPTPKSKRQVTYSIKKMSRQLRNCFDRMQECTRLGAIQCIGKQKQCLKESVQCMEALWREISLYFEAIHFGVRLLEAAAAAEWIFSEILLWLSKADCRVSVLLLDMENNVKKHTDSLKSSVTNTALKNRILKTVADIKEILLESITSLKADAEHLGANEADGTPYKGFCENMRAFSEAGHNLDALHVVSADKADLLLGNVFKIYDKAQYSQLVKFQTEKFKEAVKPKLFLLDAVMQKMPYGFSEAQRAFCRENILQTAIILLDNELKLDIDQASAAEFNRIYKENSEDLNYKPFASFVFLVFKGMQSTVCKIVDNILLDNSLLLPKAITISIPSLKVEGQSKPSDDKEETEPHADVIRREKKSKKEHEAECREMQRNMAILFQHNRQEKKAAEERKYAIEERHRLYREQILQNLALFNNTRIFQAILDPQKNNQITWKDLLSLDKILKNLNISRVENGKCIFSLFDLGSVTFHKGHGKDKSEYANAAGIDELRTLLNRMGFDQVTFAQAFSKTMPKQ